MRDRIGPAVLLVVLLALLPPPAPGADTRTVGLVVTDEQGAFVPDVRRQEVVILENGAPREVLSFERDERPLAVALVLDASDGALPVFRVHAPGAVEAFLASLPRGARVTLWTTGERSWKVGDLKGDPAAIEKKVAQGFGVGGTNALLNTLVDAAASLADETGRRRALVAVSGQWSGHTSWSPGDVTARVRRAAARIFGVMYREGEKSRVGSLMGLDTPRDVTNLTVVGPEDHERILNGLAQATGGSFESVGTGLAVAHQLEAFARELGGQYRVRFAVSEAKGPRRIEARVLRPGVHWRVVVESP
jgi:VWFA-related protein